MTTTNTSRLASGTLTLFGEVEPEPIATPGLFDNVAELAVTAPVPRRTRAVREAEAALVEPLGTALFGLKLTLDGDRFGVTVGDTLVGA